MLKTIVDILAVAMFLVAAASEVPAQDVLMNSAETINKGNIKLGLFPTVLFGKNVSDPQLFDENIGDPLWGVAGRAGYGITPRFDIEAKAAIFKGLRYFGVDIEYWLVKVRHANVSVSLGGHLTDSQGGANSIGLDTALLFSTTPVKNLELYGGLKFAFDSFKDADQNAILAHLVPGLEYRISDDLDFLAEFGIGLNGNSRNYASVGLALYLLR